MNVSPNCSLPLSNPAVNLLPVPCCLFLLYNSLAPTLSVIAPTADICSVVAVTLSTNFDWLSAAFFAILSNMNRPPPTVTSAVNANPKLDIPASIGAIPATADAPIAAIPAPCCPAIIRPIPAVPRAIDAPPDHLPTFSCRSILCFLLSIARFILFALS